MIFEGDDIILPTEFLHALYDGGAGAGLDDWWKQMLGHPLGAGGFIWAFVDEAVYREDTGVYDVENNRAPDGILGPHREKEGSFYTIKEIWAPIYIPLTERDRLPPSFDGRILVENRYDERSLDTITFTWRLKRLSRGDAFSVVKEDSLKGPAIAPRHTGFLHLNLPEDWYYSDLFELTAINAEGNEVYTWNWMLRDASELSGGSLRRGRGT